MQWIHAIRLQTKFMIMLFFPLLGILGFGGMVILERQAIFQEMRTVAQLVELAIKISTTTHELQKERGMSAGFLGSKGEKFKQELPKQRLQGSDPAINGLQEFAKGFDAHSLAKGFAKSLEQALTKTQAMESLRRKIDTLAIPAPEALGHYTDTIGLLLTTAGEVAQLATHPELTDLAAAYVALMRAKEGMGQERATLTNTFSQNAFGPGMLRQFGRLVGEQESHLSTFHAASTPELQNFYKERMTGRTSEEVEKFRKIAFDKPLGGFDVDPGSWFAAISEKINRAKEIEDRLAAELTTTADQVRGQAASGFWIGLVLVISILLLATGLALYFARNILALVGGEPSEVMHLMEQVAKGDLTVSFNGSHTKRQGIHAAAASMVDNIRQIVVQIHLQTDTLKACIAELLDAKKMLDVDAGAGGRMVRAVESANMEMTRDVTTIEENANCTNDRVNAVASAIEQLSRANNDMATAANHASSTAGTIAAASEEMTANLTGVNDSLIQVNSSVATVAAAVEKMTVTIHEVRQRCESASRESSQADKLADEGLAMMEQLAESAREIGNVTGLINSIAEQTNMLALNAAIEAAGAGQAGKGFAVVANEVKDLARQTGEATVTISNRVQEIQTQTQQAAESVRRIASVVETLVVSNREITQAVGEQANVTMEIAHSMSAVSTAAEDVTRNTQELAAAANEVARSAEESAEGAKNIAQAATEAACAAAELTRNSQQVQELSGSTLQAAQTAQETITDSKDKVRAAVESLGYIEGTAHHTSGLVDVVQIAVDDLNQATELVQVGTQSFDAEAIKRAHLKWLGKLENVVRGRTLLKAEEVTSGRECDFGKWYYSEGEARFGGCTLFQTLGEVHLAVHETARESVRLVNLNQIPAALEAMERFNALRRELFKLLDQLYLEGCKT
ncbi:MAG: hypothetical protein G8237_01240 [Magnetococcales bacterium]|nr:nitrate- and nitrite sensing domain-containing protein [Magnetococcales bacterium]NGZ04961.1 hypothetical protein [Magnetococcales bacterium]